MRKKLYLTREEIMKLKPIHGRDVTWRKYPSGEVLVLKRDQGLKYKIAKKLLGDDVEPYRKYVLDEVGSIVWELCDGENTISDILRKISRKLNVEEGKIEQYLLTYLRKLEKKGLIEVK